MLLLVIIKPEFPCLYLWDHARAGLTKEKDKLESIITVDKVLLEGALAHGLTNLKQQRPDLFTLSGPEQVALIIRLILQKF